MKKIMSIIVLAASLIAALVVFVCESPKFDNPLDEKGDNFLEGRDSAKAHKDEALKTDDNGVAEFWTDETEKFRPNCDEVAPTVALVGPNQVDITTQDVQDFRKWMRFDGGPWAALITYTKGDKGTTEPVPEEPCLTRDGASCIAFSEQEKNKTPAANNYIIKYTVKKPVCRGATPSVTAQRTLNVAQFVAADSGTPVVTLLGSATAEVRVGSTYQDLGVTVTVNGLNTPTALDSVVVKGTNSGNTNYKQKYTPTPPDFSSVVVPTTTAGNIYTVTYYASYKGNSMDVVATAKAERTVKVSEQQQTNVKPVIVLKPYKYSLGGRTVEYPDTAIFINGTVPSTNNNYTEKGVDSVYYISGGTKTMLSTGLVTPSLPSNFITDPGTSGTRQVNYDIPAGQGYGARTVRRNVFLVDGGCEEPLFEPTVKKSANSSDEIKAGEVWDYANSWNVISNDAPPNDGSGFKYFIDFNGLNPNNPVARSTPYKITYVGLGKCGVKKELTRDITVK
ncbi:hypothetical protein R80B4_01211 [Fibrobacteres bacterium R8-0-B4]